MDESYKLQIKINPDGVAKKLYEIQENSIAYIFFGLQLLENTNNLKPAHELANGEGFFTYAISTKSLTTPEKKENFKKWLIKKGIEDLIKGLKLMLMDACVYGALYSNKDEIKKSDQYNSIVTNEKRAIQKLGIPQLFDRMENFLTGKLLSKDKLLTINQVRNCLTHRNGVVQQMDANNKDKTLFTLRYSGFRILKYTDDGQEIEINGPFNTEGTQINIGIIEKSMSFEIGDSLSFDYQTFNEINLTFSIFSHDLIQKLPR
ncbi:MAG: hypothetical protein RIM83_16325 [Allomuricauda sp.]|jgi:hypothetical protein|uniref:hypothetical protein n=1 Tax=Allomuricauda sp. CP2A TaxID=1848189 RepID=UPI00082B1FD0|nr:hypothetical protein [Muricauda sp. CP2A]